MGSNRKNSILLIDADLTMTGELSGRLDQLGFGTVTASDIETGFKILSSQKPDLILLDILMKGKDGKNILTTIKSKASYADIPIIIVSSAVDTSHKVYGFLSGANDYIVKPFVFEEVLARIKTQLRILNMQRELTEKNRELTEKNMLLRQMATTDELTGLYNKRYMLKRLKRELSHAARYNEPISFIMGDIDHFKEINDQYGHLSGDSVLKEMADQIRASVREVDIVSRYGGEEFLIVCPNTNDKGAKSIAERIRENIAKAVFNSGETKLHLTISLGIKSSRPKMPINTEDEVGQLVGYADIALYKAKSNGRNRVETGNETDRLPRTDGKTDPFAPYKDSKSFEVYTP